MNKEKQIPELRKILDFEQFLNSSRGFLALEDRNANMIAGQYQKMSEDYQLPVLYGEDMSVWYHACSLLELCGYEHNERFFEEHACDFEWRFMVCSLLLNPYIIDIVPFVDETTARELLSQSPCQDDEALKHDLFGKIPYLMRIDACNNYRGGGRFE